MNLKTLLTSTLLIGAACIDAESTENKLDKPDSKVVQDFGYISIGAGPLPWPVPQIGVGYRIQSGHHGADISLQCATILLATEFQSRFLYHYYFTPSLQSQFYIGAGVAPGMIMTIVHPFSSGSSIGGTIAPQFVFGKQYRNKHDHLRFFEARIDFPTYVYRSEFRGGTLIPLITLNYGISF